MKKRFKWRAKWLQGIQWRKIRFIHDSLGEAKEFSKEVRQYLYEIEKQRPLTDMEKALWDKTHRIHVRTEDSRMMIQEQYEEVYPAVAL